GPRVRRPARSDRQALLRAHHGSWRSPRGASGTRRTRRCVPRPRRTSASGRRPREPGRPLGPAMFAPSAGPRRGGGTAAWKALAAWARSQELEVGKLDAPARVPFDHLDAQARLRRELRIEWHRDRALELLVRRDGRDAAEAHVDVVERLLLRREAVGKHA